MTIPDPKFRVGQVVLAIDFNLIFKVHSRLWNESKWIYQYYGSDYNLKPINEERVRVLQVADIS